MVFKLLGYFLYFALFAAAVVAVIAAAFFISCAMMHDSPSYALKFLFGKVD